MATANGATGPREVIERIRTEDYLLDIEEELSAIIEFGGLMFVIDDGGPSGKYRIVHGYMQDRGASGGLAGACLKRSPKTEIARYRLNGKHRFFYSREAGNFFCRKRQNGGSSRHCRGSGGSRFLWERCW